MLEFQDGFLVTGPNFCGFDPDARCEGLRELRRMRSMVLTLITDAEISWVLFDTEPGRDPWRRTQSEAAQGPSEREGVLFPIP